MKFLFFLAHPDDEAVAAGGTIRMLADQGEEIIVVLVTKGQEGIRPLKIENSSGFEGIHPQEIDRIKEFKKSCDILGIKRFKILKYRDGEINNQLAWGKLKTDFKKIIEAEKPGAVITYDLTGWYYHLDHIGVGVACFWAIKEARHKPEMFLLSRFKPPLTELRWPYAYPEFKPDFKVGIKPVLKTKLAAINCHKSQHFSFLPLMKIGLMNTEYFQLFKATKKGKFWLKKSKIFKKV